MQLLLILSVLSAASSVVVAQEITVETRLEEGGITVTARPDAALRDAALEIPAYLHSGLRSEITFEIRVYRPRRFLSFLGDHLVLETALTQEARWDPYAECYTIHDTGERTAPGEPRRFTDEGNFLSAYLALEGRRVEVSDCPEADCPYVKVRARLYPIQIADNLRITVLFRPAGTVTTPWATSALEGSP